MASSSCNGADQCPLDWIAAPDGTGVLPDYAPALSRIIVMPALMSSSTIGSILRRLDAHISSHPLVENFETSAQRLIKKALTPVGGGSPQQTQSPLSSSNYPYEYRMYMNEVPGWSGLGGSGGGSLRKYVHASLRLLADATTEEACSLRELLDLLSRATRECDARKRDVFNVLVQRASCHLNHNTDGCGDASSPSASSSSATSVPPASSSSSSAERIKQCLADVIDDVKLRAFRTCFLEPMMFFARYSGDHVLEGDVEVHGSNPYAAILMATTGIRLPRLFYLEDGFKAAADFRSACHDNRFSAAVADLCSNASLFGASFSTSPMCREVLQQKRPASRGGYGYYLPPHPLFRSHVPTAAAAGSAAISPAFISDRETIVPYIDSFAMWFSRERILVRLVSVVCADDGLTRDMQTVFETLAAADNDARKQGSAPSESDATMPSTGGTAAAGTAASGSGAAAAGTAASGSGTAANGSGTAASGSGLPARIYGAIAAAASTSLSIAAAASGSLSGIGDALLHHGTRTRAGHAAAAARGETTSPAASAAAPVAAAAPAAAAASAATSAPPPYVAATSAPPPYVPSGCVASLSYPVGTLIPEGCTDFKEYVWGDVCDPVFNTWAAQRLFAAVGVCKLIGEEPLTRTYADGVAAHAAVIAAVVAERLQRGIRDTPLSSTHAVPSKSIRLEAAGDIRGGGTGREFVDNLLREENAPWCKWMHPGYAPTSWVVQWFLRDPLVISEYGVCSANDVPERDPASWKLWGHRASPSPSSSSMISTMLPLTSSSSMLLSPSSSSSSQAASTPQQEWVLLHSVKECPFEKRYEWRWYSVAASIALAFDAVKLEISSVVGGGGHGLQLAHFHVRTA